MIAVMGNHDIGRLKVSVYYLLGVDVMHSIKQLEEDDFSLSLPTAPVFQLSKSLLDVVVQNMGHSPISKNLQ